MDAYGITIRGPKCAACTRLVRVVKYVDANISNPICLDDLASVAALSPTHFSRKFKGCTGITPINYITMRRVAAAKVMMADPYIMHAETAYACGFASQAHFCTSFKLVTGMTATEWRRVANSS